MVSVTQLIERGDYLEDDFDVVGLEDDDIKKLLAHHAVKFDVFGTRESLDARFITGIKAKAEDIKAKRVQDAQAVSTLTGIAGYCVLIFPSCYEANRRSHA